MPGILFSRRCARRTSRKKPLPILGTPVGGRQDRVGDGKKPPERRNPNSQRRSDRWSVTRSVARLLPSKKPPSAAGKTPLKTDEDLSDEGFEASVSPSDYKPSDAGNTHLSDGPRQVDSAPSRCSPSCGLHTGRKSSSLIYALPESASEYRAKSF